MSITLTKLKCVIAENETGGQCYKTFEVGISSKNKSQKSFLQSAKAKIQMVFSSRREVVGNEAKHDN